MKITRTRNLIRLLALALLAGVVGHWCGDALAQSSDKDLAVTASFNAREAVSPDTPIELVLNRPLQANEKIAVTIGQIDVSNLFTVTESRFLYDARLLPLPVGTSDLTVYMVKPNGNWNEIVRLSLLVQAASPGDKKPEGELSQKTDETKTDSGREKPADDQAKPDAKTSDDPPAKTDEASTRETKTEPAAPEAAKTEGKKADDAPGKADETKVEAEKSEEAKKSDETKTDETKAEPAATETATAEQKRFFKFLPTFTLSVASQPFQGNFPADTRPETRATFTDFDMTGSIKTEGKAGFVTAESNFDFAGSSFKEKTLQFGSLGKDAPGVDLSSYLMNIQVGKAKFSLGHTSFGGNRHLVSSFSSRGLSLSIPINKRFDISAGILNGTSVLGVTNFFGVSNIRHQMQGVTLGIEFFPKRQNAMRLEISGFNGYLQGLNNVSEGRIVDAEQSRGVGLRLVTSDKSDRFKLEFGYALSRFFNPQDTTLDPDGNAVPLAPVTRSSHYVDTSYQVLKDIKLTKTKNLNLSIGFRYEFVEPLYRSLGASASADKFSKDLTLDASVGEITFQAAHARSNDNLASVPSILTSLTRSNRFAVAIPLSALLGRGEKPSPFLPRLGYSVDRTHNFGAGVPVGGGFEIDPATIPDLLNTNQTFSSGWQFAKFTFDYTYNRSFADNRQATREGSDQLGWVHNTTFSLNPLEILSFSFGFSFDSQRNFEQGTVNQTKSVNFGSNWKPFKNATFAVEASQALAGDLARTSRNRNINYSGQFSYSFSREKSKFRKIGTQAFVRFADAYIRNRDFTSDSNQLTRTKILTAGMTLNFF